MSYRALFLVCCVACVSACEENSTDTEDGLKTDAGRVRDGGGGAPDPDGLDGGGSGSHGDHTGSGGRSSAGNGGKSGASGKGGQTAGSGGDDSNDRDASVRDASALDAGGDGGPIDAGPDAADAADPDPDPDPDPGPCGDLIECAGVCCGADQVCNTAAPTQISINFPSINGATRNVVVGSTVTFVWDDHHDVQRFPDATDYNACDFGAATLLAEDSGYVWTAPASGDFYFGCSVSDHCSEGMRLHVAVAPAQACGAP